MDPQWGLFGTQTKAVTFLCDFFGGHGSFRTTTATVQSGVQLARLRRDVRCSETAIWVGLLGGDWRVSNKRGSEQVGNCDRWMDTVTGFPTPAWPAYRHNIMSCKDGVAFGGVEVSHEQRARRPTTFKEGLRTEKPKPTSLQPRRLDEHHDHIVVTRRCRQ